MHGWIVNKSSSMNHTIFQLHACLSPVNLTCSPFCQCEVFLLAFLLQANISPTPPFCKTFSDLFQPHLPSFQPVRHLSSHLSQSKLFFPNFTLTALCASHIHLPNSSLLLTLGSLPSFIQDLKSSAHDQQGYILPNKLMNCFVSLCCVSEGRSG
jgi:hypothetical protein